MLHLILGTAGTGKTTQLIARIQKWTEKGGKAIFLVPEQYSFEAEKLLYRTLGPRLSLQVEALSFTRLCDNIFRRYGGLAGVHIGSAAKYLLMSVAVEQLRDTMRVYRKSCNNISFLETMVEVCGEFKTAAVTPDALERCAVSCPDSALRDKLQELSLLYAAYQALIERGYVDPDDDLLRACALLEQGNDFFSEYAVFVDGFATFMAAEFRLLGHIIAQAEEVHVAFTADRFRDNRQGMGVFSTVQAAAQRLAHMAKAAGVPVATPLVCGEALRYRSRALAHLAGNMFQPEGEVSANCEGIRLYDAADPYREIAYVAAHIARLIREEGYRYLEIAVVARDAEAYGRAVETVFPRYGIPYFMSVTEDIESKLLPSCVRNAVDAVRQNFRTDAVLLYAKSPLCGLEAEDVAALENYCYTWGIRGAAWLNDFTGNPRGMAGALTEEDEALLKNINRARRLATEPLLRFRRALRAGTGQSFAVGLFRLMEELDIPVRLNDWAVRLPQEERAAFLDESAQLWDILVEVLDIFGSILGKESFPPARLCELFHLAMGAANVGGLPQTLDQVLVGSADRIRPGPVRAVFVIGAGEGVFPAQPGASGVFTDLERQEMIRAGVEIAAPSMERAVLEQYFCYFALTLPSEKLFVSYLKSDLAGKERLPSVIVSQLRRIFPTLEPDRPQKDFAVQSECSALHVLAEEYRNDSVITATLLEVAGNTETVRAIEKASLPREHILAERSTAKSLFGQWLNLSPTQIERFYKCPFSYFASDGLRIRPRARVDFSPIESGSVIHNVLQVMVQRHSGKGLADLGGDQLREEIRGVMWDYLSGRVEKLEDLPVRVRVLFDRLTDMLARLLRRIGREFAQSEYVPAAFELPIGRQNGVQPMRLQTADGVPVCVEGVVDRVDVLNKHGKRYVRVVDYKSGAKQFQLHDILYGLNMQMLLYLFTIAENGRGELQDAIPAGVLYMPARESYVNADRGAAEEDTRKEREKQWKMSGLLLEDEDSLRAMEPDLKGLFIPALLKKDGTLDAKSSLAGPAEMGRLARKIKELTAQMAESLRSGKIAACPIQSEDYAVCEHCDYRSVCGFEPGDAAREIAKLDREAFFKLLEEEEDAGT